MDYNNPNDNWKYDPNKGMTKKTGCPQVIGTVIGVIIAIVLCALLGSCTTTKYVPVIEHHTDTLIHTVHHRDSIHVTDSTVIREKGDTVFVDRWHTRWHDRTLHDTIYQARHDTIPQPYPVEKVVERKRSAMEWGLIAIGTVALLGFIVWLVVRLKRFLP